MTGATGDSCTGANPERKWQRRKTQRCRTNCSPGSEGGTADGFSETRDRELSERGRGTMRVPGSTRTEGQRGERLWRGRGPWLPQKRQRSLSRHQREAPPSIPVSQTQFAARLRCAYTGSRANHRPWGPRVLARERPASTQEQAGPTPGGSSPMTPEITRAPETHVWGSVPECDETKGGPPGDTPTASVRT